MNTSTPVYLLLLCIGAIAALDHFIIFDREPGDRPIYIQTLQTIATEEYSFHNVSHNWVGVNETFTQVYVEVSTVVHGVWLDFVQNPEHPQYRRNLQLRVSASENATQLTVSFILFGFVNQAPINPAADITLLGTRPHMEVYKIFNDE